MAFGFLKRLFGKQKQAAKAAQPIESHVKKTSVFGFLKRLFKTHPSGREPSPVAPSPFAPKTSPEQPSGFKPPGGMFNIEEVRPSSQTFLEEVLLSTPNVVEVPTVETQTKFKTDEELAGDDLRTGEWIPLSSSNVAAMRYLLDEQTLEVKFLSQAIYDYYGVPLYTAKRMTETMSPGRFVWRELRDLYDYRRVSGPTRKLTTKRHGHEGIWRPYNWLKGQGAATQEHAAALLLGGMSERAVKTLLRIRSRNRDKVKEFSYPGPA